MILPIRRTVIHNRQTRQICGPAQMIVAQMIAAQMIAVQMIAVQIIAVQIIAVRGHGDW